MTLILDAGGVSALAGHRGRLAEFLLRHSAPPQVPVVVLTEALTGDHRRDHQTNHLLRFCDVRAVDEIAARDAARLRTLTGRAGTISATDAIVAAFADSQSDPIILTSDPKDLLALAEHTRRSMTINVI
jgi:predicted nucleic acid-binding protein